MIYFFFPFDSRIGGVQDVIIRWNAVLKANEKALKVIDYSVTGWTKSLSEIESIPLDSSGLQGMIFVTSFSREFHFFMTRNPGLKLIFYNLYPTALLRHNRIGGYEFKLFNDILVKRLYANNALWVMSKTRYLKHYNKLVPVVIDWQNNMRTDRSSVVNRTVSIFRYDSWKLFGVIQYINSFPQEIDIYSTNPVETNVLVDKYAVNPDLFYVSMADFSPVELRQLLSKYEKFVGMGLLCLLSYDEGLKVILVDAFSSWQKSWDSSRNLNRTEFGDLGRLDPNISEEYSCSQYSIRDYYSNAAISKALIDDLDGGVDYSQIRNYLIKSYVWDCFNQ